VPSGATTGTVVVHGSGVASNAKAFTVLASVTSISVTPQSLSLPINSVQRLTAIATYSDNSTKNVSATATWSSSNTSIATVDATGLITTFILGSATVQASFSAINGSTGLTVIGKSFQPVGNLKRRPLGSRGYSSSEWKGSNIILGVKSEMTRRQAETKLRATN
jgi:hypothetical protein